MSLLCEERRAWLYGKMAPPIERLSMLGNGRSVALVTPDARICWQCVPGPASAAVFADLLGGPAAGHFSIRPQRDGLPLGQRYLPGTMTVETRWSRLLVTDYLDHHTEPHRTDLVRVISGSAPAVVEFAPRPEFGQVAVRLLPAADGLIVVRHVRSDGAALARDVLGDHRGRPASVGPGRGRAATRTGRWSWSCAAAAATSSAHPMPEPQRRSQLGRLLVTLAGRRCPCRRWNRTLVARSALTLRALCHAGTGAILAAATTSLPEQIGGIRNWDYRHCWLRDAALTAQALVSLGSTAEAEAYLDWVHAVSAGLPGPERLHPVYALDGSPPGSEAVIDTLPGYAGSRPVRVGNLADQQVQLDVFGPGRRADHGPVQPARPPHRRRLEPGRAMCEAVARRWHEPDHGIWEERRCPGTTCTPRSCAGSPSTAPCGWPRATAARPTRPGPRCATPSRPTCSSTAGTTRSRRFTTAYDGTDLDAASLHVGLSGLLDPADERFQATVTAIEAELRSGATVYRYRRDDGLPGQEGGFHLCAAWLIEAYLLTGRRTDAEELFSQLVDAAGPTGPAARGVRPDRRALAGQPPAGLQPPGPHPLRPAARRRGRAGA